MLNTEIMKDYTVGQDCCFQNITW